MIALSIIKQGEQDIPGLTDVVVPKRLGPKRATKIRRFFGLDKKDDVRKFVIRRTVTREGKKDYTKAPKIQRLVTPQRLQRKRRRIAIKRRRAEAAREAAYVSTVESLVMSKLTSTAATSTPSFLLPVSRRRRPSSRSCASGELRR